MAESLESQIKKAQAVAKRKMTNITKKTGVDIRATPFNPLQSTDNLTYSQRKSYLNRLKNFNSKETDFYKDARRGGGLLSKKDWDKYKKAEKKFNDLVKGELKSLGKVEAWSPFGPGHGGMTVAEEFDMRNKPKTGRMMHNPSGSGFHIMERKPSDINGPEALKRLTTQMEERATSGYKRRKLKSGREQFEKMLDAANDRDLIDMGLSLSDEQFHVLWNYTNLANAIALTYEIMMQQMERGPQEYHAGIMEKTNRKARGLIEWASRL